MGVKTNNTLWAWGLNNHGQLGLGDEVNRNFPNRVGTDSDWQTVANGDSHTIAIKTNGSLWTCGNNNGSRQPEAETRLPHVKDPGPADEMSRRRKHPDRGRSGALSTREKEVIDWGRIPGIEKSRERWRREMPRTFQALYKNSVPHARNRR